MSECEFCKKELNAMPYVCPKCGKHFCKDHKLPVNHTCPNMHDADVKDPSLIAHEKLEAEHAKYLEEEVALIKKRLSKDKQPNIFMRFISFLWSYNLLVLLIILIVSGYFLQTKGIYDIKEKIGDFFEKFGLRVEYFNEPILDGLEELKKIDSSTNESVYIPTPQTPSKIKSVIDEPRRYLDSEVTLEGFVYFFEFRVGLTDFMYRIADEGGNYIYLMPPEQRGFAEYTKYEIRGIIKQKEDTLYLEANKIVKT